MKTTLLFITLMSSTLFTSNAHAFSAECAIVTERINFQGDMGFQADANEQFDLGFWSASWVSCKTKNHIITGHANLVGVSAYTGNGLGESDSKKITEPVVFYLECPLVSEHRLEKRLNEGRGFGFAGPKATVGILLSLTAAIGFNGRGAVCFMGGTMAGFGFQSGIQSIQFENIETL